jgi:hypothetical protein
VHREQRKERLLLAGRDRDYLIIRITDFESTEEPYLHRLTLPVGQPPVSGE